MRALKLLAVVAAVALAIHWWSGRAERVDGAAKSPNGFVSVIMPEGARRNTVIIFAPLNCPSDAAQRAAHLADELTSRGIPNVRSDSYDATVTNPTADQEANIKRTNDVVNAGVPAVFINGRAKANPTLDEVIAEYSDSRQQ
jgi:hypothetical protein